MSYDRPTGEIETKLGTICYRMDGGDRVFLSLPAKGTVTINRVAYRMTHTMHRADGRWRSDLHCPALYRANGSFDEPSWAAKKKADEILTAAWVEFINANPGLLLKAERARLERECEALDEKIKEAEEIVRKLRGERRERGQELADVTETTGILLTKTNPQ